LWADKAINEPFRGAVRGHRSFSTLKTKAAVLHAMNRDKESDAVMNEALSLPGNDVLEVHSYGMSLLASGRKDRAMEVFQLNRRQHPDDRFVTYVGLARGYTAIGDKANAIGNWELALRNVPEDRKALIPMIQGALKKLRENAGS
jgi:predicted Zn-dependent protease